MPEADRHRLRLSDYRRIVRTRLRQMSAKRKDTSDTWVLVFPQFKIAYIPIPKAANSSVRAELVRILGHDPSSISDIQEFRGFDKRRLSSVLPLLDPSWFVFTVVRDPYARFASAFLDKIVLAREPLPALRKMGISKSDGFGRFARMVEAWPTLALNDHVAPQTRLLSRVLHLPYLHVYRTETLATDWPGICRTVAERTSVQLHELGRRNSTRPAAPWQSLYDPVIARRVGNIYRRDFSAFSYDDAPPTAKAVGQSN